MVSDPRLKFEIVGKNILSITLRKDLSVVLKLNFLLDLVLLEVALVNLMSLLFDPIVISGLSTDFFGDVDKIPHPVRLTPRHGILGLELAQLEQQVYQPSFIWMDLLKDYRGK